MNLLKGDNSSVKELFDRSARAVRGLERYGLTTGKCIDSIRGITLAPLTAEMRATVIPMLIEIEATFQSDALDQLVSALREVEKAIEGARRG